VPFAVPELPDVIVSHVLLLAAVHEHPAPAETDTVPVLAPAPGEALDGLIAYVQAGAENENWFESELAAPPPGPRAVTRASYVTLGGGTDPRRAMKSTRILPSLCGAGLLRFTVANGVAAPAWKSERL
jgi:hypothetical protein